MATIKKLKYKFLDGIQSPVDIVPTATRENLVHVQIGKELLYILSVEEAIELKDKLKAAIVKTMTSK